MISRLLHYRKGNQTMPRPENSIARRDLLKKSLLGAVTLVSASALTLSGEQRKTHPVRLGGPVFGQFDNPDAWVQAVRKLGYSAAYCPIGPDAADDLVKAYAKAAKEANIVIDEKTRNEALAKCRSHLALADRIAANCCVNITGSRGSQWDGPSPENFTKETFEIIVQTTRTIIDDVKPTRTYFTLETMPWAYPDSPDSYLQLLKAIDRKRFAVHLDPVNIVCSPQRYFATGRLIRECFEKLGPYIKSCHAKDIILSNRLTTHLDEIRPGLGGLDYEAFLTELSRLPDMPLMLEHLSGAEEYRLAAEHIRSVAKRIDVRLV
jgi:sugar phosphate isomerase/epimerase